MAADANAVKALFLAVLEKKTAAERTALLDQACAADATLRQRVEALLRAHDQPDSLLDQPAVGQFEENMETTPPAVPDSGPPLPAGAGVVRALGSGLPRVQLREPEGETLTKVDSGGSAEAATAEARELPARYQMAGEIARGGMGAVLRGRDTELGREIAVKVLLETHQGRTELVQRFVDEAQIAGQLQHPGIAPVYDMGTSSGKRPYFTMKLVKGQTLAKLLAERGDPGQDRPRLLKVFEQVCQTLAYAHARGVIHRDLKPANIMVGAFGEVQVMDWGLAKVLASRVASAPGGQRPDPEALSIIATARSSSSDAESGHTQAGTAMGTPAYMSPEQARGEVDRIDERADVFGLGALLCHILTGKPPFPGKSNEAMRQAKKADLAGALTRLEACDADAELIALAKRCLAAEPEDRPRHAGEVAGGITAYLESVETRLRQAEVERAQAQVKAAEERKRRRLTAALAASVLLTVTLGGGGYAWLQQQRAVQRMQRERKVDEALEKVAVLRGQAAAATVGDLSGWIEAQAEAGRAQDLLAQGEVDETLSDRVAAVQAELQRGRDGAERRARNADAERQLLARLEVIRGERGDHWNAGRADRDYAEAFRAFGLDFDELEPEEAGIRLAGRPGSAEIATALDEWSRFRRFDLASKKGVRSWLRLVEVARKTDPDPWRDRLRALFGLPLAEAAATLRMLADNGSALQKQPATSLVLLDVLLKAAGEMERREAVLRLAWQRFPGDFWVNFDLGMSSWSGGRFGQPEEAVRFLTAAVATRPGSATAHNNLGNALKDQGKVEEAIAALRKAVALDPKYALAHSNLGGVLNQQGKVEEAFTELRLAIALDPKFAGAHHNLGISLYLQGNMDEAISACREAIKLDPEKANAHYILGVALSKQGKLKESIAACRQAIALDPKHASALCALGYALDKQGKVVEAIACWKKAIALDPKHATAHYNLGNALFEQSKLDEAVASYSQAIKFDPKLAGAHYNLGNALYKQGKEDEAVACYRHAIALDPKDANAHNGLGNALRKQGKVEEAIACYRQAIALAPKHTKPHNNLGNALKANGDLIGAIAAFRKVVALDPKSAQAHLNLGLALDDKGLLDEAITSFEKVIALEPRNTWGHTNLGWALRRKGRINVAIACYRKAVACDPSNVTAHNNLGFALRDQGKLDDAVAAFRQTIKIDPNFAAGHDQLGWTLRLQGKLDEAILACRKAVELQPREANSHNSLGVALRDQGKLEDAIAAFREANTVDPKYTPAYSNLGIALRMQGKLNEALTAARQGVMLAPTDTWANDTLTTIERIIAVQDKLPAVLKGTYTARTSDELHGLKDLCLIQKRYLAAARMYAAAFAADPKLADDLKARHRYVAACHAALAVAGKGIEKLDDKECMRWRKQALEWLKADLALRQKQAGNGKAAERATVQASMRHWQRDASLAALRDKEAIAKLPEAEREGWQKLWADVDALLQQALPKPAKE